MLKPLSQNNTLLQKNRFFLKFNKLLPFKSLNITKFNRKMKLFFYKTASGSLLNNIYSSKNINYLNSVLYQASVNSFNLTPSLFLKGAHLGNYKRLYSKKKYSKRRFFNINPTDNKADIHIAEKEEVLLKELKPNPWVAKDIFNRFESINFKRSTLLQAKNRFRSNFRLVNSLNAKFFGNYSIDFYQDYALQRFF